MTLPLHVSAIEQERGECVVGVADELGLGAGLASRPLRAAAQCWPTWTAADRRLSGPADLGDLREWLTAARPADADQVLHTLVQLGSPSGGDERLAVDVVAWALLPGARAVAARLRGVSADVDQLIAAQLWLEVRTFPWERLRKVAANVLANTRARVLSADLAPSVIRPHTRAGFRLLDPHSAQWERLPHRPSTAEPDAAEELTSLLVAAREAGVVGALDLEVLRVLVEQAGAVGGGARRGMAGLLADRVVVEVVEVTGLSPATVRRRVRRSVNALADAQRAGLIEAA